MNKQTLIAGSVFLLVGLLLGWLFFGGSTSESEENKVTANEHQHEQGSVWTCSMHPQIRENEPGQCPICGMDLIPANQGGGGNQAGPGELQMTEAAMRIAEVQTTLVGSAAPSKKVYLPGKVKIDERRIADITSRFGGRIETLFVNFTGQKVGKGQKLASIYSPELVTAQKELLEAASFKSSNPSYYEAAKNKLKLWNLSEQQIEAIAESKELTYYFNVLSPQSGTVVARNVSEGDYVKEGESLFEIANLGKVWIQFDAYENDLPWIHEGDTVEFSVRSVPGETFQSTVTFIDPVIDPKTRVASVRTEVANPDQQLKPEMFVQGVVTAQLKKRSNALLVPKSAVLWTGKRAVVYVKDQQSNQPSFSYREVVLGPETGDAYVVNEGLQPGEEVVSNGVFKIDAAAQLEGKSSMMNPVESSSDEVPPHGAMEMEGNMDMEEMTSHDGNQVPEAFNNQLWQVVQAYLRLKDALVASDASQGLSQAKRVQSALEKTDMHLLKGDLHLTWMEQLQSMQTSLKTLVGSTELKPQRKAFGQLSQALYNSLKTFKPEKQHLYYQRCPMREEEEGAFWLSDEEAIRNPYYGDQMLTCGAVEEKL